MEPEPQQENLSFPYHAWPRSQACTRAHLPVYLQLLSSCLWKPRPLWPLLPSNTSALLLPQGLCICCFLCQESSYPHTSSGLPLETYLP